MNELITQWCERVREAADRGHALRPRGGGSKDFLGRELCGEVFDTRQLSGVVEYEPSELVVTVLAGTPLTELQACLAEKNQYLPFEPPGFGEGATVGGCVASGLSGPGRARAGALRDFVLGVQLIDGQGSLLRFGGQVMKNVAGYDVSRLMAGSMGTLGLIVEVSLKVLPRPFAEASLEFECSAAEAILRLNQWSGQPLPISASSWHADRLRLRLSGATAAVASALAKLGGQPLDNDEASHWWCAVREHQTSFHQGDERPLWRFALPDTTAPMPGDWFMEWGGGLRWCHSDALPEELHHMASSVGGNATLFRGGDRKAAVYPPLSEPLMRIQQRLKQAFDPAGIFSPGRLYDGY